MEAVLKNLSSTLELLAVSQTEFVRDWDAETVDRAFQWATYCEHIYTRFHTNPGVRPLLEDCLCLTNEQLSQTLPGHNSMNLAHLAQCRHRLFINLLRNPAAPHSVIKSLFDTFQLFEQGSNIDSDLSDLIRYKSSYKLLASFPLTPTETCGLALGPQVQGMMLLQRIHTLQSNPGNETFLKTLLDSVLQDCRGMDHISEAIAAAVLVECTTDEDTTAQTFLLDWLQEQHGLLHHMCQSLPTVLCTKLSQKHPKFWLLHLDILKKWASSLEYDLSGGVWVQKTDSPVSFQVLLDHLKALWSSGSQLKEKTVKELVALKQADGDFEVQGLSVWTDLLIQFQ